MTREEAIAILETAREQYANNCIKEAFDMAIDALTEQRPHGQWKNGKCTNCGAECFEDDCMRDIETEFCQRCGADMRKEGEAE